MDPDLTWEKTDKAESLKGSRNLKGSNWGLGVGQYLNLSE